ncbi:unnamed protein product [Rhizopus microsporus]
MTHVAKQLVEQTRIVKNGKPFFIYIERYSDNRRFHLVDIEGKDYGYFDPKKACRPAVFAFYNPKVPYRNSFTSETWDAAQIYEVRDNYFVTVFQRLGKEFYWARTSDDAIKDIKRVDYNEVDKGYRMRLDINNRDDS